MGVIGSAKLLQALARDHLLPGLSIFGQGTQKSDDPTFAIIITYILAQLTMLSDINQIASFITMTYLMTFLVTNLACFLLKIGSAPNFRPSFHFFNWQTAAVGAIASGATMFFVDGVYASACVALLIIIFLLIHYTTPPKPWGDVSQSLIVRTVPGIDQRSLAERPGSLFRFDERELTSTSTTKFGSTCCDSAKSTSNSGDRRFFC